ncbi:MAG: hypothetical protein MR601_01160 [Erysipelotrichaceae bacterium]|nr:hypothetical protein [Erysipelotrichaceae bacterium]
MPSYIVAGLYAMCIAGIYGVLYYFNHKTPVPKGCEDLKANCEGCNISSCELHPVHENKEDLNA